MLLVDQTFANWVPVVPMVAAALGLELLGLVCLELAVRTMRNHQQVAVQAGEGLPVKMLMPRFAAEILDSKACQAGFHAELLASLRAADPVAREYSQMYCRLG
jgi:hypothetical protein